MNALILSKKNKKFLLIFLLFALMFNAQSKRFYYLVNFKLDSAGTQQRKDVVVLEINKDHNIFLSNDYIITDSINNIRKDDQSFAYPKFQQIVKFQKSNESFDFIQNLSPNYYQFSTKNKIDWMIVNEKKKIGKFDVIKAVADYGGRHWTAWFCQDLPFPYGPYVFYGLPGLILEVYDDGENYHFSFTENRNYAVNLNSGKIIEKLFDGRKINIKENDWKTVQLNYYANPIPEYKSGKAYMEKDSGEKYSANDYRELEKTIQQQIKKYNNPIELDKAVKYPEK
jgi:GLPGLI family protein